MSNAADLTAELLDWLLGLAFGRFDVRQAIGQHAVPVEPDPFAPLPACAPGMLQDEDGRPLSPEAGRRLRDAGRYPLDVAWDGILVDDPGHPRDIEWSIQQALALIGGERADALQLEACALLGVPRLRDWFRRPAGFFADHLQRHSKSRRKAPVYWPLATASGSYCLWIYYPQLTSQTLYTALNDFIEPKIKQVQSDIAALRAKASSPTTTSKPTTTSTLTTLFDFELELIELRDTLLKLAPGYRPNQDDGVQITAAPLWPLFRHKPWQKILKDTWTKLEKGDYDWSHLAMADWSERVREKCKTDKSLAIAHGLEALYVEPEVKPKKTRKRAG